MRYNQLLCGRPHWGAFGEKKLKKQFDLDGINENAEEKAARAKGVGAHLHLQMFLGDWKTDLAFSLEGAQCALYVI